MSRKMMFIIFSPGCRQKKMLKGQCPMCSGHESASEKNIRVVFLYTSDDQKDKKLTMFKDAIQQALKQTLPAKDQSSTIMFLIENLPISFSGCISASNSVYNINNDA
jgi:hypothetical protein